MRTLPIPLALQKRIKENTAKVRERKEKKSIAAKLNPYKISSDFKEFLSQCRIRSGVKVVPFNAYDYQLLLNEVIDKHPGIMILKDRQLGITELLGGRILFKMLHNPAFLAAVISINQEKASEVSRRVQSMPSTIDLEWERISDKKIKPKGCGEGQFVPSTDNAIRGLPSVTELNFDEAGFIPKFAELYGAGTSAQEMVPIEHRKTILNTTVPVEGTLSEFWGMFDAANGNVNAIEMIDLARDGGTNCGIRGMVWWTDQNGWAKVILGHKVQPKYDHPGYLEDVCRRRKIPMAIAQREHNLGIETAEGSLFSSIHIDKQSIGAWSGPIQGHHYLVCVDPNFGGSDNHVVQVIDITSLPYSLVAEYADNDHSTDYAKSKTLELMDAYSPVLTAIESNSGGKVIAENIAKARPRFRVEVTVTTHTSKAVNTDRIALAIEQGELIYPADWQGIGEMKRFSKKDRCATGDAKDDRVMALAAGFAWLNEAISSITQVEYGTIEEDDRDTWGQR
jgi:Terminase RNaseH-like domain